MAKILLLESYKSILQMLNQRIEALNHVVFSTTREEEAIKILQQEKIDVIIIDLFDGVSIASTFLKTAKTAIASIPPLLIITTSNELNNVVHEFDVDFVDFIFKPATRKKLKQQIDKALNFWQLKIEPTRPQEEESILLKMLIQMQSQATMLDDKIQILTQQLASYKKETAILKQQNQELTEFADIVAHDLREPLRSISNSIRFMKEDYADIIDDTALEYLSFAEDGAKRLNNMIIALTKYTNSKSDQSPEEINCNQLLKAVQDNLTVLLTEAKATIEAPELPTIVAFPYAMMQIFQNLIANATKFQQQDSLPVIKVDFEERSEDWLFSISDNGIGIDQTQHQRVFKIFQRLNKPSEYDGDGIGLAICKQMTTLHNGEIWVESIKGEGATFFFTISKQIQKSATIK